MQTITQTIIDTGFKDNILTETDILNLVDKTAASRHALINKALQREEMIRIRRGLYALNAKYRMEMLSKLVLANHIVPYSYVSLESALAYYGWIPEKVTETISVIPTERRKTFHTPFGVFTYYPLHSYPFEFLTGVERESSGSQSFLIASPLRALADYIYFRKADNINIDFLQKSLRIEADFIHQIQSSDLEQMRQVFRSRRVKKFLIQLEKELKR